MPAARELNILIVDDQQTMRALAKSCLNQIGVLRVADAADGKAALNRMLQQRYDVVICDWIMPDMDGLTLLGQVRKNAALKTTPFIMASAHSAKDKIQLALAAGANVYVQKPFKSADLKGAIESIVGKLN